MKINSFYKDIFFTSEIGWMMETDIVSRGLKLRNCKLEIFLKQIFYSKHNLQCKYEEDSIWMDKSILKKEN